VTNYHTTVLDHDGLIRLLQQVAGRRLVGVADGLRCVELVFDDPDDCGGNLVSIFTGGYYRGHVALGFVAQELIEAGYGTSDDAAAERGEKGDAP
jgi:hypothetical protein